VIGDVPVFWIDSVVLNPVFHCVFTKYVTWHAPAPPADARVVALASFEGADSPAELTAVTR
jgi:hypothetical protein